MEFLAAAKAHVLRHSGTSADEAAELLLGDQVSRLHAASVEARSTSTLERLFSPSGPIFQGARLLTADRCLAAMVETMASAPLDAEGLWSTRRQLRVVEALAPPDISDEVVALRALLDQFLGLSCWWESAVHGDAEAGQAATRAGAVVASAAAGLFVERLRRPETRVVDLLLDGLPFALGYLRDRSVTRALVTAGTPLTSHLVSLHESLWSLIEREASPERCSYERLRSLDNALETVFVQIRAETSPGAQLAAVAALYRLNLCVRAVGVRATIRNGIELLKAAASNLVGALPAS